MSEDEHASRPSRYRSLRKQASSSSGPPNTISASSGNHGSDQQHGKTAANSISRSMSRYRRRAASVSADSDTHAAQTMNSGLNNPPPVPAIPLSLKPAIAGGHTEHGVKPSAQSQSQRSEIQRRNTVQTTGGNERRDNGSKVTYRNNRSQMVTSSRNIQNEPIASRDTSWEEERDRLLEEQKRKDLQRLEEELESSQRVKAKALKLRSPVVEKFVALAKGHKSNKDEMLLASPMTTSARSSTRRPDQEPAKPLPAHIEPGGKGVVPQKDAPTSAINAGDRSVVVRYRHRNFSLNVNPETTAVDIITQTSDKTTHNEVNTEKCLVVEQYGILGLERRLRRYERIRDVLNSWDSDAQNHLAIVLTDPQETHEDLHASTVIESEDPPSGCQFYMYHSNRPGKWNKRWITLLQSGQIVCAKKPNAKTTDKDTASLCHLSDYDIYTPTESQMRRHIKPPKRFCFAIKSQHKTTLFLNTDNYVQYFSTEDPSVAREFKQKAHGWRSWYLVGRNPEARKKQTGARARTDNDTAPGSPPTKYTPPHKSDNIAAADGQRLPLSIDESIHSDAQFEPLIDMKRFDRRLSQAGREFPTQSDPSSKPVSDQKIRRRLSKREKPGSKHAPPFKQESEEGFTGGLLGEEYDNRKQVLANLEEKKKRPQELTFTDGPSLLNGQQDSESATEKPQSPSWFPSAQEHTAKQRTDHQTTTIRPPTSGNVTSGRHLSLNAATHRPTGLVSSTTRSTPQHPSQYTHPRTHAQPHPNPLGSQPTGLPHSDRNAPSKPLVDLTPTFQEPPQWSKDKRGHGVKPPEGIGHLVDFITGGNGTDSTSNRSVIRRPTTSGSAPLGRTRSMSAATSSARPLLHDIPPMPPLPSRSVLESDSSGSKLASAPIARDGRVERRETVSHREREQEKARYREREAAYNAVPGRTGTLKVV